MNQFYRVSATGQWCAPSYENGGADPDAIAEALGLAAGSVELVEAEDDPRGDPAQWLAEPPPPDAPGLPGGGVQATPRSALLDALDAAKSVDDLRAALLAYYTA